MSSEAKDLSLMQQEVQDLEQLNKAPLFKRWKGYTKYTGPAFLEAATTLGAGSFASCAAMGAAYGYKMDPVLFVLTRHVHADTGDPLCRSQQS